MKKIYLTILFVAMCVTHTVISQNVSGVTITPSIGTGGTGAGALQNDFTSIPITVEQGATLTVTWTLTHGTNNIERAFFVIKQDLSSHPGNIIGADNNIFAFPGVASPYTETDRVFNIPADAILGDHLIKINGKNYNAAPATTSVWGTVLNVPVEIVAAGSLSTKDHNAFQFAVYPNPAKEYLNIQTKENITSAEVINVLGQSVMKLNSVEESLNISSLTRGMYILKLVSDRGISTKRIIKQ